MELHLLHMTSIKPSIQQVRDVSGGPDTCTYCDIIESHNCTLSAHILYHWFHVLMHDTAKPWS